jgi:FkbM family methyltransferase
MADPAIDEPKRPRLPGSLYELKKAVLAPRTAYRRRQERDMDGPVRQMFELSYYNTPTYDFLKATMANPDILVDVDADESCVVLDVGAYVGQWTKKVVDRYGATVHAFEPAASALQKLHDSLDDDHRVHIHEFGLSDRDAEVTMALAGPGSSIYSDTSRVGFSEIRIRDVAAVLDDLGLTRIDLLKVNIEGGEYDLFDRLDETGWLRRTDQVLVQFHEWHPNAYRRRRKVRHALRAGHEVVWSFPWVWEYWRQPGPRQHDAGAGGRPGPRP